MILWILLGVVGAGGTLLFGGWLLFLTLFVTVEKATDGSISSFSKREAKGILKLFLISLALFLGSMLLSSLCR